MRTGKVNNFPFSTRESRTSVTPVKPDEKEAHNRGCGSNEKGKLARQHRESCLKKKYVPTITVI